MGGTATVSWKLKGKESFAQVVSGKGSVTNATLTVQVYEVGNGWLLTSALVRLKPLYCGADFKTELREGEASCNSTSVVAQTVSGMGKPISGGACGNREVALNVQNGVYSPVDGDFSNPGLLKSLSGSDLLRPGLNIEVILTRAPDLNEVETQTHRPPAIKSVQVQSDLDDSIQPCSVKEPLARNGRGQQRHFGFFYRIKSEEDSHQEGAK
ncbi:hypothetical protein LOK49_LG07G01611 [Camellia lanceoleosa]|uniref:Uncharacterized protein n=1 Tax=Camellia lanceoleosa TaxID=1840588 RepID=A0ACC0H3S7_9ERIC|nr:hypothetical protein LOK49_LG07G01611 [Camellia lanceoleosa]